MEQGIINLTDTQAAWLAGLIDADGCISLYLGKEASTGKPTIRPQIAVYNTSAPLLTKVKAVIGYGCIGNYKPATYNHHATRNYILMSQNLCEQVLEQIIPYLVVKKEPAEWIINFCRRTGGPYTLEDLQIYEQVKLFYNRPGKPLLESKYYKELKEMLKSEGAL